MWYCETDRTGILRMLGASGGESMSGVISADAFPTEPPPNGKLQLFWIEKPVASDSLPNLFVTANGDLRDFLAWTSTYLDGYRPLTALCRIIDWDILQRSIQAKAPTGFSEIENACAAVTLAEALTHGRGKIDPKSVNIPTCESTYSFCKSRVLAQGLRETGGWAAQKWRLARSATKQPERVPTPETIDLLWKHLGVLAGATEPHTFEELNSGIVSACSELMTRGTVQPELLRKLFRTPLEISGILKAMTETRERRVSVFENILHEFVSADLSKSADVGFFCGYLASLLNPGSFEYYDLVTSHLDSFPTLLLWYGLCEGLHPQTKILGQFSGLCRRVLRDIRQGDSILSVPQCDISVDELEVLSASRGGIEYLRVGSQFARVEIHPFVNVTLRSSSQSQPDQRSLFGDSQIPDFRQWVGRMGAAIANLEHVYEQFGWESTDAGSDNSGVVKRRRGRKK